MSMHIQSVLGVLKLAERLKFELRHSYTSSGRQESVAEHTWRMSLMAILVQPLLTQAVDMEKLLKMIIIHDLVEAEARDVPVTDILRDPSLRAKKIEKEKRAIENLRLYLEKSNGQEIYDLWHEFEAKQTYEAKLANAFDKLEVQLQHNEADISTWEEIEYELSYMMSHHTQFDEVISTFKDQIEDEAEKKMINAGIDVLKVKAKLQYA
jgi:putative hydrolase of HD superfamily